MQAASLSRTFIVYNPVKITRVTLRPKGLSKITVFSEVPFLHGRWLPAAGSFLFSGRSMKSDLGGMTRGIQFR